MLVTELAGEAARQGVKIEYLDLGGGLGISYNGRDVPSPEEYVSAVVGAVNHTGLPIVIEPGRVIAGPAGMLLARIIDLKRRDETSEFAVLDAGMAEIMRPALYNAYHVIEPVVRRGGLPKRYELVGPICESTDVLGRDRELPPLEVGDLVAIRDAGAYGLAMASNYNRHPIPAEVLVEGGHWRVIRRRQTIDDMTALES